MDFIQSFFDIPVIIFIAVFTIGFFGSLINAFAGGGTFFAFPVLLWAGLPPIMANATCKIAFIPGNIASAFAYRHYFSEVKYMIASMVITALIGGTVGALLTVYMGNDTFKICIPWLILMATLLSWRGTEITKLLQKNVNSYMGKFVNLFNQFLLIFTSIYGGFFGAGIGVLLIATLNLRKMTDINVINAIKNVLSVLINLAAVIMYMIWGVIDWHIAVIQMLGAVIGGYVGGVIGYSLNPHSVRVIIMIIGLFLTVVYFYKYGYFSFLL